MQKRIGRHSVLKALLPIIFIGYVGVFALYTHIHIVGGVTVVHAHPFKKAANVPFHQHSQAQFELINSLSSLHVGDDVVSHFVFGNMPVWMERPTILPVCRGYASLYISGLFLRAPPFLYF